MTETAIPSARPDHTAVERLRDLNDRATSGVWSLKQIDEGHAEINAAGVGFGDCARDVQWIGLAKFVTRVGGKEISVGKANGALTVALVNAYRSGHLVERTHVLTPSAGVSTDGAGLAQRLIAEAEGCEDLAVRASIERRFREAFAEAARCFRQAADRINTLEAALARQSPASGQGDGALREVLTELERAASAMLISIPDHWHDDATIELQDAAQDARKALERPVGYSPSDDEPEAALATPAVQPAPDGFVLSEDDVLFAFHRYAKTLTPDEVTWWTRAFPQHAAAIREHAVEAIDIAFRASAPPPPAGIGQAQTGGVRDVLAERRRQVEVEGWTPEHDDAHDKGEMVRAAANYAAMSGMVLANGALDCDRTFGPPLTGLGYSAGWDYNLQATLDWPWDRQWWKPGPVRPMLVKAGALILAEIERLDRASADQPRIDGAASEGEA